MYESGVNAVAIIYINGKIVVTANIVSTMYINNLRIIIDHPYIPY